MRANQAGWTMAAVRGAAMLTSVPLRAADAAAGAPSTPRPARTFTIVNRLTNPAYYAPGKVIPAGANTRSARGGLA